MSNLLGDEDAGRIEIISNYIDIRPDGHFSVKFRHPERCERRLPLSFSHRGDIRRTKTQVRLATTNLAHYGRTPIFPKQQGLRSSFAVTEFQTCQFGSSGGSQVMKTIADFVLCCVL
jgi:hypothetical protein